MHTPLQAAPDLTGMDRWMDRWIDVVDPHTDRYQSIYLSIRPNCFKQKRKKKDLQSNEIYIYIIQRI